LNTSAHASKYFIPILTGILLLIIGLTIVFGSSLIRASSENWSVIIDRIKTKNAINSFIDFHQYKTDMKELAATTPDDIQSMIMTQMSTEDNALNYTLNCVVIWRLQVDIAQLNINAYQANQSSMDSLIENDEKASRDMDIHVIAWNAKDLKTKAGEICGSTMPVSDQLKALAVYGYLALPYVVDNWKATGNDEYLDFVAHLLVSEDLTDRSHAWIDSSFRARLTDDTNHFQSASWISSHQSEIEKYRNLLSEYNIIS
jgi:hypothetical protein